MVKISFDFSEFDGFSAAFERMARGGLPALEGAVAAAAHLVAEDWRSWAGGHNVAGIKKLKFPLGGLARSIGIRETGPLSREVYSDAPHAAYLEWGTAGYDMKRTHPYGPRSRVSKDGTPFVIVPFRWGTPKSTTFRNVMSAQVYGIAAKFKAMKATGETRLEKNAKGLDVARQEYNGDYGRLGGGFGDMSGMVKGGEARHRGYVTFRVISAKSPPWRWVNKGIEPYGAAEKIARSRADEIREIVQAAAEADL